MIETIEPDSRGRVTVLKYLNLIGWEPGEGVEVDFIKPVTLMKKKKNRIIKNPIQ